KRSRTLGLKRLYKVGLSARVESSGDEEDLGEDASKQGRKIAIDADEDITLVNDQDDADMFNVNTLAVSAAIITDVEITLAQALAELKSAKPKADKVVIQEPKLDTTITTPTTIIPVPKPPQDKSKGIMIKEPVVEQVKPIKRLEQMRLDKELAFKLQAEEEEERIAREKAQQIEEANIAWDDVQAKIFDVDALAGEEVFVAKQSGNVVEEVVFVIVDAASTIPVSVAIITDVEITLAQALAELKSAKPKADKVVI
ncbi:hypothetical protein Tco_0094506, partial [Tanacetum coccineum]